MDKLKKSEGMYSTLIERGNDGIIIIGENGLLQFVNPKMVEMTGFTMEEAIGKPFIDFIAPEHKALVMDRYKKRIAGEDTPSKYEIEIISKAAEKIPVEVNASRIDYEGKPADMAIVRDITERKQAEAALQESEEKYRAIVENATDLIFTIDEDCRILSLNKSAATLLEKPQPEITGKTISDIFPEEIATGYSESIRQTFKSGEAGIIESRIVAGGQERWLNTSLNPLRDQDGKIWAIMGISRDITERERTEEALKESEEKYRSLFENMLNGFAYCEMIFDEDNQPVDFVYLDINDSFERLTGLKRENVLGRKVTEAIPGIKEANPELFTIYGEVALTGKPTSFEVYFEPLEIWLTISVYSPQRGYFAAVFDNITERKRAEERILHLSNILRAIRNVNQLIVHEKDRERLIQEVCTLLTERRSYERAWILLLDENGRYESFAHAGPGDNGIIEAFTEQIRAGKFPQCVRELLAQQDDCLAYKEAGKQHKGCIMAERHSDHGILLCKLKYEGRLYGVAGGTTTRIAVADKEEQGLFREVNMDIAYALAGIEMEDLREQAEEALWKAEENFRNSLDDSPVGARIVTKDGELLYANRAILDIYGYSSAEEMESVPARQRYTAESYAEFQSRRDKRVRGEYVPPEYEISIVRKDGKIRHLLVSRKEALWDGEQQFQVIYRDITEQKQLEEQLVKEKEFSSNLVKKLGVGLAVSDEEGKLLVVNDELCRMTGYSEDELIGSKPPRKFWAEEELAVHEEAFVKMLKGYEEDYELLFKRKDDERFLGLIRPRKITNPDGSIIHLGILQDITERKRAEEALRESQRDLNNAQRIANIGSWDFDLTANKIKWSAEMFRIFGIDPAEGVPSWTEGHEKLFHPDDWPGAKETMEKSIAGVKDFERVDRFFRPDGSIGFLFTKADVSLDSNGNPIKLVGVSQDITARMKAVETLRQSEEKFRNLVENAPVGIAITDVRGRIIVTNNNLCEMFGYDSEEELLKTPASARYYDMKDRKRWLGLIREKGRAEDFEVRLKRKDGSILWASFNTIPQITEIGEQQYITTIQDISERKEMETSLRRSEEKYSKAFRNSPDGIALTTLKEGRFIEANESYLRMYGFALDEIIGHTTMELDIWTGASERKRFVELLQKQGRVVNMEADFRRKSGAVFNGLLSSEVIELEDGKCILNVIKDISERKRMEKDLRESEERYRTLFDSAAEGILITDNETKQHKYANPAMSEILGYSQEELKRMVVGDLPPADSREHPTSTFDTLARGEKTYVPEVPFIRKDGATIYLDISATSAVIDGRKCILGFFTDVTERRQAEERLEESERLYSTTANWLPIGVFIVQDGKFVFVNRQFQEITGRTAEELIGTEPLDLVFPEDREIVRKNAIKMLKGKPGHGYEYRVIAKSGETKIIFEAVSSIQYQGKQAALGNYMDITERKKMEEQLIVTDRLASIGELASGIAHELNNPLTAVIGFSELLIKKNIPDEIREDIMIIHKEAERTSNIVRNLLSFARKHPEDRRLLDINKTVRDVMELRAYEQGVNNIEVETSFTSDLPEVMANSFELQQVFINIIINAEFFMNQAHGRGKLTVITKRDGDSVRISFKDDGPGIAPKHLSHIFDPFFTTKEVGKGTGLGLSIAHGIITAHGGRIYAESQPGNGTTFTIELPPGKE